jgi:hypothetical protein
VKCFPHAVQVYSVLAVPPIMPRFAFHHAIRQTSAQKRRFRYPDVLLQCFVALIAFIISLWDSGFYSNIPLAIGFDGIARQFQLLWHCSIAFPGVPAMLAIFLSGILVI